MVSFPLDCMLQGREPWVGSSLSSLPLKGILPVVREKKYKPLEMTTDEHLFGGILGVLRQGEIVIKCSPPSILDKPNCKFFLYNVR